MFSKCRFCTSKVVQQQFVGEVGKVSVSSFFRML